MVVTKTSTIKKKPDLGFVTDLFNSNLVGIEIGV